MAAVIQERFAWATFGTLGSIVLHWGSRISFDTMAVGRL